MLKELIATQTNPDDCPYRIDGGMVFRVTHYRSSIVDTDRTATDR
jgi:hypothetical protein